MNFVQEQLKRKIERERNKKHSRTSPEVQFKKFSWTKNRKLALERTMNGLRKPFRKKSDAKN